MIKKKDMIKGSHSIILESKTIIFSAIKQRVINEILNKAKKERKVVLDQREVKKQKDQEKLKTDLKKVEQQ